MCLPVSESLQLLLSCRHITDGVFGGRRRGGDPVVPVASHPGRGLQRGAHADDARRACVGADASAEPALRSAVPRVAY